MKDLTLTIRAVYGRALPPNQLPDFPEKDKKGDQIFVRRRLDTHGKQHQGPQGPDQAYFVPGQGLVGHAMYHTDYMDKTYTYEERAVLIQSMEHYLALMRSEKVGKYFAMFQAESEGESMELVLENPKFGEQIIVQGCTAEDLCIGDVFECENSTLKLEVTSPRFPCNYVDRKMESPFGSTGVRRHTLNDASAGWFCRVLEEGEVSRWVF